MTEIPKRRFAFPKTEESVDLYLDGKKVINKHRGETGNYYFRIPEDAEVDFQVADHDPNIPLEAEVTPEGLKPIERKPKFVDREKVDEAAKLAEQEAKRKAEAQKAKEEALARAAALKGKTE